MDATLTENLRTAVLLLRETSQSLNTRIAEHVDPALGSNSALVLLTTLSIRGPQRPGQLAHVAGLSPAGLTGLLNRVEESGFVERATGTLQYDRRSVMVTLTLKGHRYVSTLIDLVSGNFLQYEAQMKEMVVALERALDQISLQPREVSTGRDRSVRILLDLARLGRHLTAAMEVPDPSGVMLDTSSTTTLLAIDEAGQCRPGHLSDRMQITSGGTTRVLDRLTSAGLVSRTYGSIETDRRATLVQLTDEGRSTAARALENVIPHTRELHAAFREVCQLLADIDS